MHLYGITGFIQLKELYPETLPVLLAGELIHIGKNTSFGFGRYRIM
ncbi:MAG: CRISPR system precrRNA processing endoribonuclease RAMP protein Cas6 [Eubacterium sp.]|nr:CRISPR system precrRNA processing endoribonuclease RAMP protein Cas6 [Eubacterium sp.]